MRVAMVSEFPEDLDHPTGGVEAVAACLSRGLVARGVDLTVVWFGAPSVAAPESAHSGSSLFPIIRVSRRWPATITNWLVSPFEVQKCINRIAPEVVHVQGLSELYRGRSVPSVLTVHGISFRDVLYRRAWLAKPMSWVLRASFTESMRNYRNVISISPYVSHELGERSGIRYWDIPNPVEDCFFEVERRPEPNSILYVGVLSRLKNIVGLLDGVAYARERVPGVRVRLAGPWHGDYEGEVRESIRRLGLEDSVALLGSLPREKLVEEFASCSCLVLSSFQESSPMAIEEAMASGVPVLASRVGGVRWMIKHERTGFLFDPHRSDELGSYLVRILSDSSLRDRMGKAARASAYQRYRLDAVVDRTLAVYEQAINEHARGRSAVVR